VLGDSEFVRDSRPAQCAVKLREQDQARRHVDEAETLHEGHESRGMQCDNDVFTSS